MTDAAGGPLSAEEARIRAAADQAYRVLGTGDRLPPQPDAPLLDALRLKTRESPLQALAIAFLIGVYVARRHA